MGAGCCKPARSAEAKAPSNGPRVVEFKKPKWKSEEPMTVEKLQAMRDEFWDTEPHYGGDRVIWDALRAAAEADLATAKLIVQTAGVVVTAQDMTTCYDERGRMYVLPQYTLAPPTNLIRPSKARKSPETVELPQLTATAR